MPSPPGSPYLTTAEAVAALQQAAVLCYDRAADLPSPASEIYAACGGLLQYLANIFRGAA